MWVTVVSFPGKGRVGSWLVAKSTGKKRKDRPWKMELFHMVNSVTSMNVGTSLEKVIK